MPRLSLFNSPLLLGFDHLEEMVERLGKAGNDGYPPYNIEQTSPESLRITLAVAGFTRGDLFVSVEGNQLSIRGKQTDDEAGRVYLHRGIAARQFQRVFLLAQGIDVAGASLDNGLLNIDLIRPPAETRVRNVDISSGATTAGRANGGETIDLSPEKERVRAASSSRKGS